MEKYCITIKEASVLSGIGLNRLRNIIKDEQCPFVLKVGTNKHLIKVEAFKEWLKNKTEV